MIFRMVLFLVVSVFISALAFAQPECKFNYWKSYNSTNLLSHPIASAYLFSSAHMAIDADGAPNAYHPEDIGLDFLANAGYPDTARWNFILVPDPNKPSLAYTQPSGEFAGYFVSQTSLFDKSKLETDPVRYVDARNIPYFIFPGSFYKMKGTGRLGDLGYAINLSTGDKTSFIVADIGPHNAQLGEVSIALAEGLGGKDVNPRNGAGAPRDEMLYIVFPYSSLNPSWPLSIGDIERRASSLLEEVGDIESILACQNTF